jgi:hypothetical protein
MSDRRQRWCRCILSVRLAHETLQSHRITLDHRLRREVIEFFLCGLWAENSIECESRLALALKTCEGVYECCTSIVTLRPVGSKWEITSPPCASSASDWGRNRTTTRTFPPLSLSPISGGSESQKHAEIWECQLRLWRRTLSCKSERAPRPGMPTSSQSIRPLYQTGC